MTRSTARSLVLLLRWGAWTAAALTLSSCSKKELAPEPYQGVIGELSSSQLIVYPDVPLTTYFMQDTLVQDGDVVLRKAVCSEDDSLLGTQVERAASSATVHGYIFDYSPASGYQIFREGGSGFHLLKDYVLQPVKRYPQGNADVFMFEDPSPPSSAFQDYVGRGVVNGTVTPSSPLTNLGKVTVTPTASILYTGRTSLCGDEIGPGETPPDSLIPMSWTEVPGAAGYWVQIYQFGNGADVLAARYPGPAFVGRSVDFFLAYFPASVTAYKIGDPLPAGSRVLTQRTLLNGTDYAIRITAVNDDGELIAYPSEASRAYVYIRDAKHEGYYSLRTLGAFIVHTTPMGHPPPSCPSNPPCGQALGTTLPNVKVFPPNGLPLSLP